jgi:hypothetical protein
LAEIRCLCIAQPPDNIICLVVILLYYFSELQIFMC